MRSQRDVERVTTRRLVGRLEWMVGCAERSVGNVTRAVLDDQMALDVGLRPGRRPLPELVSFAGRNWEFFLAEAMHTERR